METGQASKMSRSLKAVSDVNRIRILGILVNGEFCVSDLVERLGIDQPKVSHHLAILRGASIILSRRQGRHINYSIRESIHRREQTPQGLQDVFDLGELSVSFRFVRDHDAGQVLDGRPAHVPPPARQQQGDAIA
jgi:ArsR family transcriptional regulator